MTLNAGVRLPSVGELETYALDQWEVNRSFSYLAVF